jgi:hypothetical protein|tara:strand:- start:562 stop:843 length:282 start_codon:yes stop_codon:yes gene_type:complete
MSFIRLLFIYIKSFIILSPPQHGHTLYVPDLSSKVRAAKNGVSIPIDLPSAERALSIFFLLAIAFGVLNFEIIISLLFTAKATNKKAKSQGLF